MNPLQKMMAEAVESANRLRTKSIFPPEKIAEVAHGAVRALQAVFPTAQMAPPWGDLDPERRRQMVDSARTVVRAVESTGEMPDIRPAAYHEKFLSHHLKAGWRYGPTHSAELKQSPLLLPWSEIPDAERMVGFIFHTVVAQMASAQTSVPDEGQTDA